MANDRFANEKYVSWLKVGLSLQFAKEGLEKFSDDEVKTFHSNIQSQSKRTSTPASLTGSSASGPVSGQVSGQGQGPGIVHSCTAEKLKKEWKYGNFTCQVDGCDILLEGLRSLHVDNRTANISWDNVDVPKFSTQPWECAKLYMPYGCRRQQNSKDADIASLLTLYMKCTHFGPLFSNVVDCKKIKKIRNRTMHSGTMEVETPEMSRDIKAIIKLLEDPVLLKRNRNDCKEAVRKIKELLSGKMELSLNKELELKVLNDKLLHLEGCTNQLKQSQHDMSSRVDTLSDESRQALDEIQKLQAKNKQMNEGINSTKQDMAKVKNDVKTFHTFLMDHKLNEDRTEKKILDVNKKLSGVETEMNKSTEKLGELSDHVRQKFKEYDRELSLMKEGQRAIKEKQKDQDRQIEDLQEEQNDLKETQTGQRRQIEGIQEQINPLKGKREYSEMEIKDIQDHLRKLYNKEKRVISHFPFKPSWGKTIEDMHVTTKMAIQKEHSTRIVYSVNDMFHSKEALCKEVIVCGKLGDGKTSLCEHLSNLWTNGQIGPKPISNDEHFISSFTFLFYITLKAVEKKYDSLEDLITSELKLQDHDVADLMSQYHCLIVFDGLDELTACSYSEGFQTILTFLRGPSCTKCTYLMTSRLSAKQLASQYKFDRIVVLDVLEEQSQRELVSNTIDVLDETYNKQKTVDEFFHDIKGKHLEKYLKRPVLLFQVVGLWYHEDSVGLSECISECTLYSSVIETQMRVSECIQSPSEEDQTEDKDGLSQLPECFKGKPLCQKNKSLLCKVSKLAYERTFDDDTTFSYVFGQEQVNQCDLSNDEIKQLLDTGILISNRQSERNSYGFKSLSFPHRGYQEFVSALYISTTSQRSEIISELFSKNIRDLDLALELDTFFLFVCGLSYETAFELYAHIMNVVSTDKQMKAYRQSPGIELGTAKSPACTNLIIRIQELILAATEEARKNSLSNKGIGLHDILVSRMTDSCKGERICMSDISSARSFCCCTVVEIPSLSAPFPHKDLIRVHEDVQFWPNSPFLEKIVLSFVNLPTCASFNENLDTSRLSVLYLENIPLLHEQIQTMFVKLEQSENLRKIVISCLKCLQHENDHYDILPRLTLTAHKNLESLQLTGRLCCKGFSLCSTMSKLREVKMDWFSLSMECFRDAIESLPKYGRVFVQIKQTCIYVSREKKEDEMKREVGEMTSFLSKLRESSQPLVLEDNVKYCHGKYDYNIGKLVFYS